MVCRQLSGPGLVWAWRQQRAAQDPVGLQAGVLGSLNGVVSGGGGGCGFRLHLLAGLTDPGQPALLVPQLLRQLSAALALAVVAILLSGEDLGLPLSDGEQGSHPSSQMPLDMAVKDPVASIGGLPLNHLFRIGPDVQRVFEGRIL
jgi:hypothetical protein